MKSKNLPVVLTFLWSVSGVVAAPTDAIIDWTGDAGYHVRLSLTYDDSIATAFALGANQGMPTNSGISQLSVSFYNPAAQPLFSTVNVSNSAVVYDWLSIEFDTSAKALTGFLDVGKDTFMIGDLYLIANNVAVPSSIRLVDVTTGSPLDVGGEFTVTIVPEPTAGILLAGLAGWLAVGIRRRKGTE